MSLLMSVYYVRSIPTMFIQMFVVMDFRKIATTSYARGFPHVYIKRVQKNIYMFTPSNSKKYQHVYIKNTSGSKKYLLIRSLEKCMHVYICVFHKNIYIANYICGVQRSTLWLDLLGKHAMIMSTKYTLLCLFSAVHVKTLQITDGTKSIHYYK